ncbi:hypothetical protein EV421DRAFT_168080 [Armillaria borealis]|uniref:Uncharacterized protein n=1 Tax=Armillaria borealis TaxID=47425 RepID=A0AA39IXD6_9AGAR|nr:hypothetical protein EV421DRAFT_168080 [Armillaria borealis]
MLCSGWSSPMFVLIFLALEFRILTLRRTGLDQALIEIATWISRLQELETRMVKDYGITNSVEVLQETLSRRNAQSVPALKTLNMLYELRLEFAIKQRALRYRVKRERPLITSVTAPHRIDISRFWAVIIGIDAYEYCSLHVCVSDVLFMGRYLTKDLGVPKGRIERFTDTQAHIS